MQETAILADRMQRSRGRAEVALSHRTGATRLDRLHQPGFAKAMLPYLHAACTELVFLNNLAD